MATPAHDKYFLKTLHEEIDLYDRKLAHSEKYDTAGTDAERKVSTSKMAAKRETLARTARQLVSEGIEFKPSDLPRSFRTPETPVATAGVPELPEAPIPPPESVNPARRSAVTGRQSMSPFAGTVLDGQAHVEAYKRSRVKTGASQA